MFYSDVEKRFEKDRLYFISHSIRVYQAVQLLVPASKMLTKHIKRLSGEGWPSRVILEVADLGHDQ